MSPNTSSEQPLGLRERRRLQTENEIHEAAITLFEQKGVAATTVQDIADAAGISSRTFFRYFASKEQAALPGQRRMVDAMASVDFSNVQSTSDLLRIMADVAESVMLSENQPSAGEHRRIARLLATEGDMRSLAAAQEQYLGKVLRESLERNLPNYDAASLLLVAEISLALWRTSWMRWGELSAQEVIVEPIVVFRECRATLDGMLGGRTS